MDDHEKMQIHSITLDIVNYQINNNFATQLLREVGSNYSVQSYLDSALETMVIEVERKVASEVLEEQEVKIPSSWFQHFKQDRFPRWLLRKYPVQYRTVKIVTRAEYPNISLPEEKHRFVMDKLEGVPNVRH